MGMVQRRLVNPVVRLAWALRLPIPGDALLETTDHRTSRPRRTPICDGTSGDVFWAVAQRGRAAAWVRDLTADSRVRVRTSGSGWRTGTAHVLPDDDPGARRRAIGRAGLARRLCQATAALSDTDPVTIRIDLDPVPRDPAPGDPVPRDPVPRDPAPGDPAPGIR